jgi:hypothetical protein
MVQCFDKAFMDKAEENNEQCLIVVGDNGVWKKSLD